MDLASWRETIDEFALQKIVTEEERNIFMEHKSLVAAFGTRLELQPSAFSYCHVAKRRSKKYPVEMAREAALRVIGAWRVKNKVTPPSERFVDNSTQTYLG